MGQALYEIVYHLQERIWIILCFFSLILIGYASYLREPRQLERAMARKLERARISQILSDALQDAAHNKKITPEQWHKYDIKIGKALGLTDMIPLSATSRLWSGVRPDLNKTKLAITKRLDAMGVNIADGLKRVRNGQTKKDRLLNNIKRKPT